MARFLVLCVVLAALAGAAGESRTSAEASHAASAVTKPCGVPATSHLDSSPLGDWERALPQPLLEEFMIDSSLFYAPPRDDQYQPSVAFDGTNYLMVWADERISRDMPDIFGTRVDPSGTILDPQGISICTASGDEVSPSVVFDGVNYLVVWEDYRRGIEPDIYGARVDISGTVLDPSGIEICTASMGQSRPRVASDGTNSLVVWQDSRGFVAADIWGARVNRDGIVIDPLGIPFVADTFYQACPSVAFDGTNYLLVWVDGRGPETDICGMRLSQSMWPLDSLIAICTAPYNQYGPSIVFGGTDCFVAWNDQADDTMHGTRVDIFGNVLDPSGIVICTTASGSPSVAFDGQDYLVAWNDSGIYGARVTTSGTPLDLSGLRISVVNGAEPCVASDGVNSLVAWRDMRGGNSLDIYGARVTQSGAVLDTSGILISVSANQQVTPSVVYGSGDYFAIWGDDRNGGQFDVYGARVDPSGTVLDPLGIMICGASGNQQEPCVAFGSPNYLAAWLDGRNGSDSYIFGTRFSQSGTLLDSSIVISDATHLPRYPAVASGRDNYLVVWQDDRTGYRWHIWGARVDTSGLVLDTSGIGISTSNTVHWNPAIASDGTDFFAVWAEGWQIDSLDIYGARVTESGTVLDTSGIAISTVIGAQFHPSVAFDGTNYFVVWEDYRFVPYSDIYGARVDTSGVVLEPYPSEILISTADGDQLNPSVSFDGNNYFVVWEDGRRGDGWDIYGARVGTSGVVLDTAGVELIHQPALNPENLRGTVVAGGPLGQFLLVHDGFLPEPYYSPRAFGAFYPDVGVTESKQRPKTLNARLLQNRPNPFRSWTVIQFQVSGTTHVSLRVHDVSGRVVGTLVDGERTAGLYEILWDGKDNSGHGLPSGVYFCRLKAGDVALTKKMVVAR